MKKVYYAYVEKARALKPFRWSADDGDSWLVPNCAGLWRYKGKDGTCGVGKVEEVKVKITIEIVK